MKALSFGMVASAAVLVFVSGCATAPDESASWIEAVPRPVGVSSGLVDASAQPMYKGQAFEDVTAVRLPPLVVKAHAAQPSIWSKMFGLQVVGCQGCEICSIRFPGDEWRFATREHAFEFYPSAMISRSDDQFRVHFLRLPE